MMMMKKYGPAPFLGMLILLTLFSPSGVFSQATGTDAGAEPPHVSGLRAESRNNLVRLTWIDSPAARGPVLIYRSNSPFDSAGIAEEQMLPVEVPYGVGSYIDEAEGDGWVYYFVAVSNEGQERNRLLRTNNLNNTIMPLNNTLAVNIRFEEMEFPAPAAVVPRPPLGISGLNAIINGEGVTISWQVNDSSRNTVLYRSVQPIRGPEDLLRAVIIQSGLVSSFVDYPVPGISYYYAVIYEDDLAQGFVSIIPETNATTEAAAVMSGSGRVGLPGANTELRSMPLPLMALNYAVPGIDSFPELSKPIPLGGFVFDLFGKIPVRYEKAVYNGNDFIIQDMDGHKINTVKIVLGKKDDE